MSAGRDSLFPLRARLRSWRAKRGFPAPWVPIPWRWRLWFVKHLYDYGTALAKRLCHGNKYGVHTDSWPAYRPIGGQCLCSRVRERLDYIPF